jgi:WD40 repeat protein
MAYLRQGRAGLLSLALWAAAAGATEQQPSPIALYDRPVLVVDPGMHTGLVWSAAADAEGRWAVTGSADKTVRIWSLTDGTLTRTIRLPAGPGKVGRVAAVAISSDGKLIFVGGSLRTVAGPQEQIDQFDRDTGVLLRHIDGLPDAAFGLASSTDGALLAVTLRTGGLRIYEKNTDWTEVAHDEHYNAPSYGVAISPDGAVATASFDGRIRLYAKDLRGAIQPTSILTGSPRPYEVAFSPDGTRLAVGNNIWPARVDLLDAGSLSPLGPPDLQGIRGGGLMHVAWSRDGSTLYAAGQYLPDGRAQVLAWTKGGAVPRHTLSAGHDTISKVIPLPGGDLLVASFDTWLARLAPDGTPRWRHEPAISNLSDYLSVSEDGTRVGFGFGTHDAAPTIFDIGTRRLIVDSATPGGMSVARQTGLPIEHWRNEHAPTLAGEKLVLDPYETSRSLAIEPNGRRFVLGTEWALRAFDDHGTPLWIRANSVPGIVRAVNITRDGRLVVAAYNDGTIRWHRMSDGGELLAFMPLPDRTNWVAWTPEGFYAATAGAYGFLRWHVNRGWDAPADSVPIEDIPGSFRPAVLPLVLQELETPRALGLAELAEHNKQVAIRTHSQLPPGVQLHLLTIGISAYNENYAKNLRLRYADRDAHDLASAIVNTQGGLYSRVDPQVLLDKDATRGGILAGLDTLRKEMERGAGNDLAVVHFSGHGAVVDDTLYLLPYETDARGAVGIKTTALSVDALKGELIEIAKHGRVLVLLDACHSGATSLDGSSKAVDATVLRHELAAANVTVLTSSSGQEVSLEDDQWQHGAFTRALLDALNDPAADPDRVGLINANVLAHYVARHVASLTNGKQTPDMEVRFDTTVFAVGL